MNFVSVNRIFVLVALLAAIQYANSFPTNPAELTVKSSEESDEVKPDTVAVNLEKAPKSSEESSEEAKMTTEVTPNVISSSSQTRSRRDLFQKLFYKKDLFKSAKLSLLGVSPRYRYSYSRYRY